MRITTLGALAALSMTLTSTAVWQISAPADEVVADASDADASDTDPVAAEEPGPTADGGDTKVEADAPPPDQSTFLAGKTLMVEGRVGHGRMLADARGETFLYVDVRNELSAAGSNTLDARGNFRDAVARTSAEPLNLAIVIDHSGSMKGQRERNALDAAAGMISRLRDGDTVSVVSYNTKAHTIVPVTTLDARNRDRVISDLRVGVASRPSGNTCVSCGVEAGLQTLQGRRPGIDRMLLLSDGEANRGVRDEPGIRRLAREARNRGVSISSIGVDVDYNEVLMSAIAREANGRHYFSETGSNLDSIFDQELDSLIQAIAKNGQLIVELAPGVRVVEVFDRSYQQVDRRVIVPMGTFSAGEDKTLLMRLEVPPSPEGGRPLAHVSLSYDDLSTREPGECFGELATVMTATPAEVSPLDAIVLARLTKSETAKTLQQSNALFALGRADEAQRLVEEHLGTVRERHRKTRKKKASGGLIDPFNRDFDEAFNDQASVLEGASGAFEDAAAEPAPATSRPAKAQVRRNAEQADLLSL